MREEHHRQWRPKQQMLGLTVTTCTTSAYLAAAHMQSLSVPSSSDMQADARPSLMAALGRAGPPPAPPTSAIQLQLPTGCLGAPALNVMRYVPEVSSTARTLSMTAHTT